MVVGKLAWTNIRYLTKVRSKDCTGVRNIAIFLLFLFAVTFLTTLTHSIFDKNVNLEITYAQTYSYWAFLCMILLSVYYTLTYQDYNNKNLVFPQSNVSSILSLQLYCYLSFIKLQLFALFLYFIHYGLLLLMDSILGIFEFAYQFSIPYIIKGFCVNIAYGFLIMSSIQLLGSFDRKFKWLFRGVFLGFIFMYLYFIPKLMTFGYILEEESLIKFLFKVMFLWIIISILSIIIHIYTKPSIKLQNITTSHIIITSTILILIIVIGSFIAYTPYKLIDSSNVNHVVVSEPYTTSKAITPKEVNYLVDISNVPDGTHLLTYSNIISNKSPTYYVNIDRDYRNKTKDQLLIDFYPNEYIVNDINMNLFTNPQLDIKINDNQLIIKVVERENLNVIFISPYTFMKQFEPYRYHNKYGGSISSTSTRNFTGSITVYLPKEKNLSLSYIN